MKVNYKTQIEPDLKSIQSDTKSIQHQIESLVHNFKDMSTVARDYSTVIMALAYVQKHDNSIPKKLHITKDQLNDCILKTEKNIQYLQNNNNNK